LYILTYLKRMPTNQLPTSFQFEAIFHEAAIGILVTNARFEILISNEFLDQLFGYEVGELIGQNIAILIPNHLKMRHEGHLEQVQHTPISRPMGVGLDLKAKRKDESLFPIEISLSHFRENEQMYYIAFVSDVSLKRKVEMELILKNQEINQLNESLSDFIGQGFIFLSVIARCFPHGAFEETYPPDEPHRPYTGCPIRPNPALVSLDYNSHR